MKSSETTKTLSDALSKALGIIHNPQKSTENSFFKSRYATLEDGLNIIREAFSKCNLSFFQATRLDGDILFLETRIMCGNEWLESEYPVCRFPCKPQELGSAMTYARRYSLFACCGIAGELDDDGNAANGSAIPAKKQTSSSDDVSKSILEALTASMQLCSNIEEVDVFASKNLNEINKLLPEHKNAFRASFKAFKEGMM